MPAYKCGKRLCVPCARRIGVNNWTRHIRSAMHARVTGQVMGVDFGGQDEAVVVHARRLGDGSIYVEDIETIKRGG